MGSMTMCSSIRSDACWGPNDGAPMDRPPPRRWWCCLPAGVRQELLGLMRVPGMNAARARALFQVRPCLLACCLLVCVYSLFLSMNHAHTDPWGLLTSLRTVTQFSLSALLACLPCRASSACLLAAAARRAGRCSGAASLECSSSAALSTC